MKKLLLVPLTAMLLGVTGCGNQGYDYSDPLKLKIRFHVDSKSKEGLAYAKIIDDFNNDNEDGIKVKATFVARSSGDTSYDTQLAKDKRQKTLPDIVTFDAPKCGYYAHNGYFYDMSNVFSSDEKDKYITLNTYKNNLYGIPIQESSAGIFVNKRLLNQAGVNLDWVTVDNPWTFDQFKETCAQLKNAGITPADMRFYDKDSEMGTYLLYPFIYAAGGKFVDDTGRTAQGYFNSEKSIKGFQFLRDLIDAGYAGFHVKDNDFFKGNCAMYLSSGWTIPDLDKQYTDQFPNRDSWALLPYPKDEIRASANGSWSYAMCNTVRKDKSTVIKLMKYITNAASSKLITDTTGMIPAHKDVPAPSGAPENVLLKQLSDTSIKRPETVGYKTFSDHFRAVISALSEGSVKTNVDEKARLLQMELDKLQ